MFSTEAAVMCWQCCTFIHTRMWPWNSRYL